MGKGGLIATLGIGLKLNDKGFKSGIKNALSGANQLERAFKGVAGVVAGALSVKALVSFGSSCIELGSNLSEVQNVVDTVFPSMNQQINEFSKNAMTQFGISETLAKNYTSTLGAMSRAFGYSEAEAYAQATALTGLVGDMASFYNKSTDETFNVVKAIYSGETEVLKAYGIVMTETALNEYAMQMGINKTVSAMTEQEKVALRLSFVQDRMSMASGDFAKTSDSWANQTRMLTLAWDSFKATIGQGLINVLTPIVQWFNAIMASAQACAQAFADFTASLMGISSVIGGGGAGALASDMAGVAESAEATNRSIGGAGGGAKKLKGILAGFDKLNILNSKSGGGGGGGGGVASALAPMAEAKPLVDSIKENISGAMANIRDAVAPTVDALKRLKNEGLTEVANFTWENAQRFYDHFLVPVASWTFGEGLPRFIDALNGGLVSIDWDNLIDKFTRFYDALAPFAINVGEGLLWFWENVLVPLGSWTIDEVLPQFLDTLSSALEVLNAVIDALQPVWQSFWDNVLVPIASWTADTFISIWDSINDKLKTFADWCKENPSKIQTITGILVAFFAVWEVMKIADFITCCGGVVGALTTVGFQFLTSTGLITAWNAVTTVASGVASVFAGAMSFLTSPIGLVVLAIGALIAVITALALNWDTVKEALLKGWEAVKKGFSKVAEFFGQVFQEGYDAIVNIFSAVGEWASGVWDNIKSGFSSAVSWFGETFGGAFDAIKEAFTGIGEWASGLWEDIVERFSSIGESIGEAIGGAFRTIVNGVLQTIENTINTGIGFINGAVSLLNEIPGVNISGFSELELPRLAQGGFVEANTPQLAMIGDNRHEGEIVAPESKISEAVAQGMAGLVPAIANAVASAVRGIKPNSSNDRPIQILLDGQVIYDTVTEYQGRANSRSGGRA